MGQSFVVSLEVHMFIVRRLVQDNYPTANCRIPNGWTLDLAHIQPTAPLQVLILVYGHRQAAIDLRSTIIKRDRFMQTTGQQISSASGTRI